MTAAAQWTSSPTIGGDRHRDRRHRGERHRRAARRQRPSRAATRSRPCPLRARLRAAVRAPRRWRSCIGGDQWLGTACRGNEAPLRTRDRPRARRAVEATRLGSALGSTYAPLAERETRCARADRRWIGVSSGHGTSGKRPLPGRGPASEGRGPPSPICGIGVHRPLEVASDAHFPSSIYLRIR